MANNQCYLLCGKGRVKKEVIAELEDLYKKLQNSSSKSMLKKYLKKELFDKLKDVGTPLKASLLDCIRCGE